MIEPAQAMAVDPGSPPSLLFVTTVAETMWFLLPYVRHFRSQGWRVDGCASGITEYERAAGQFDDMYELSLSRSLRHVRAMAVSASALRATLDGGYDIVHVHTPIVAFITRALIRRMPAATRPKVVYTAHGFHFHEGGHPVTNAFFITAEQVAGRWTDRLVVINEEDHAAAKRYRIVPRRRLRYMRGIGVDTDWYAPGNVTPESSRQALVDVGMDPERPYFVTVGELSRRKRPTDVVRALARMRNREPALLFLGSGPERAPMERIAAEAGIAHRVVIPGTVGDVRPLIAPALALVHGSSREGLPRSIMEALSLQVPVIATDARGQAELVGGDRGRIVPIGGIDEMAAAMDAMLLDAEGRSSMGRRGRQLMIQRYDLRLLIAEHERLYAGLLAEEGSAPNTSAARA